MLYSKLFAGSEDKIHVQWGKNEQEKLYFAFQQKIPNLLYECLYSCKFNINSGSYTNQYY